MSNIFFDSVKKDDPLNSLNDTNDLTRLAYSNKSSDIPLRNNSLTDRFETDTFINNKESFESNNSRINSLNEEIRELKMNDTTEILNTIYTNQIFSKIFFKILNDKGISQTEFYNHFKEEIPSINIISSFDFQKTLLITDNLEESNALFLSIMNKKTRRHYENGIIK